MKRSQYNSTALGKSERYHVKKILPELKSLGIPYAFVGNVGLKAHISRKYRGHVNKSEDLDIMFFDRDYALLEQFFKKGWRVYEKTPLRHVKRGYSQINGIFEFKSEDPFQYYSVNIPIDDIVLEIDAFTYDTGVTFIPFDEEDMRKAYEINGIPTAHLGFLMATNINPYALTKERLLRVNYALEGVINNDPKFPTKDEVVEEYKRKLKEGISRFKDKFEEELKFRCEESLEEYGDYSHPLKPDRIKYNLWILGIQDLYPEILREEGLIPQNSIA